MEADNRKFKEQNPEGAKMLNPEQELIDIQVENVRLAQQLSEAQQGAPSQAETDTAGLDELSTTNSALEVKIKELHGQLEDRTRQLTGKAERVASLMEEIEHAIRRPYKQRSKSPSFRQLLPKRGSWLNPNAFVQLQMRPENGRDGKHDSS